MSKPLEAGSGYRCPGRTIRQLRRMLYTADSGQLACLLAQMQQNLQEKVAQQVNETLFVIAAQECMYRRCFGKAAGCTDAENDPRRERDWNREGC